MSDALHALRRIMDKQSPPRRQLSALILFDRQRVESIANKTAHCIALTSRHVCIWSDDAVNRSLNSTSDSSPSPAGTRLRRRSSTGSTGGIDWQYRNVDSEWPTSLADWIHRRLNRSVQQLIGVDFRCVPHQVCSKLQEELDTLGEHRLVDACQMLERACPIRFTSSPAAIFPMTGFTAYGRRIKQRMSRCWPCSHLPDVEWLVVTALDEICWLFDLRNVVGRAMSSAILGPYPKLFIDGEPSKQLSDIVAKEAGGLAIRPTDEALSWMADLCGRVAVSEQANEAVYRALQNAKCVALNYSPVAQAMSRRNDDEREALQELFQRDSAAVCCFLHKVAQNGRPNPQSLTDFRSQDDDFRSDHNQVRQISPKRYMLRSKAIYSEGICLVARAIGGCCGKKTRQPCTYTLSVRAFLKLLNIQFPAGKTSGSQLDAIAVRSLYWAAGLEPPNETGRALGLHAMLDSPLIGSNANSHILEVGNVLRLDCGGHAESAESCVLVCKPDEVPTTSSTPSLPIVQKEVPLAEDVEWLRCRPLTMVPFDAATLDISQFTKAEIDQLNEYNSLCYEALFERLEALSHSDSCVWLKTIVRPIGD